MSYMTDKRSNPVTIAAVIGVHAAIGYAFISGLAMTVIQQIPVVTLTEFIPDQVPPPPEPPAPARRAKAEPTPTVPIDTVIDLPRLPTQIIVVPTPPTPVEIGPQPDARPAPPPPAGPSLARTATPSGNRAAWVTSDDYPPAALRAGVEGTTTIRIGIGADGRVTDCTVTAGSGDPLLDQAACRFYARRAKFTPALDEAGRPVAGARSDRVTWRIPR